MTFDVQKLLITLALINTLYACSSAAPVALQPTFADDILDDIVDDIVVVDQSIVVKWTISHLPADGSLSHAGIPGNLAHFPRTRVGGNEMRTLLLGEPHAEGSELTIKIIGSHQFVDSRGLTTTLITVPAEATTTHPLSSAESLEELEQLVPGALLVIEAGILDSFRASSNARSLGFLTTTPSLLALQNARESFENENLRISTQ